MALVNEAPSLSFREAGLREIVPDKALGLALSSLTFFEVVNEAKPMLVFVDGRSIVSDNVYAAVDKYLEVHRIEAGESQCWTD